MIETCYSVICMSLGLVLVVAGLAKIKSFRTFRNTVEELTNLSDLIVTIISIAVIAVELALGLCFVFGITLLVTFWVCFVMMLAMTGISRIKSASTPDAMCLCFGQDGVRANSWKSISRSVLILSGTVGGLLVIFWSPNIQLAPLSLETTTLTLIVLLLLAWITDLRLHHE